MDRMQGTAEDMNSAILLQSRARRRCLIHGCMTQIDRSRGGYSCCSALFLAEPELVYYDLHDVFPLRHGTQSCRSRYDQGATRGPNAMDTPISPHANFLPMGPTTWYPTTSRTTLICSAVSGCSYMSVFMAGNTYVGVVGASARSREVCWVMNTPKDSKSMVDAHCQVVACPMRDLSKRIGGARSNKDDVSPSSELDV